jgi:hypothetical protein
LANLPRAVKLVTANGVHSPLGRWMHAIVAYFTDGSLEFFDIPKEASRIGI